MISTADVAPIDIAWMKFAYGLRMAFQLECLDTVIQ